MMRTTSPGSASSKRAVEDDFVVRSRFATLRQVPGPAAELRLVADQLDKLFLPCNSSAASCSMIGTFRWAGEQPLAIMVRGEEVIVRAGNDLTIAYDQTGGPR